MLTRTVITIDGLAASGKSTIARELAHKLGYAYLNSGLLYRAVAWLALDAGLSADQYQEICALLDKFSIQLVLRNQEACVLIDGKDCTAQAHEAQVSEFTSQIATIEPLRRALEAPQRNAFAGFPLVAEGRDMGTVIFPDAPLKFYVSASLEVRAERRQRQQGDDLSEVLQAIQERDRRDQNRSISPTIAAKDAVQIENSGKPLTEVLQEMYDLALRRGLRPETARSVTN